MDKSKKWMIAVFILAVLFANLYFIYAAHIITPNSFSKTPNVSSQYNITINNTDTDLAGGNITVVSISLPTNFTFIADSNGTDSIGVFANTTNVLNWTNSTGAVINVSHWRSFWFNANVSHLGNYTLTLITVNTTSSYVYNLSVLVQDTTEPTISFTNITPSNSAVLQQSYIPVGLNASDDIFVDTISLFLSNSSNLLNVTRIKNSSLILNFTGLADGTYYINASVNDTSNNVDSTSEREIIINLTGSNTTTTEDSTNESENETEVVVTCVPNWRCTEWIPEDICPENETRTRVCTDLNNCDPSNPSRNEESVCVFEEGSAKTFVIIISAIIALAALGIAGAWFYTRNKSEEGEMGSITSIPSIPPETPLENGNIYQPQQKPVFMARPMVYGAPARRPVYPYQNPNPLAPRN